MTWIPACAGMTPFYFSNNFKQSLRLLNFDRNGTIVERFRAISNHPASTRIQRDKCLLNKEYPAIDKAPDPIRTSIKKPMIPVSNHNSSEIVTWHNSITDSTIPLTQGSI